MRELTLANRIRVLAEPECKHWAEEPGCARRMKAENLDTRRHYSADGTQLEEEIGPLHEVRLESGTTAPARFHKVIRYDKLPKGVTLPTSDPDLPTSETTGAWVEGVLYDERATETQYDGPCGTCSTKKICAAKVARKEARVERQWHGPRALWQHGRRR